MKQVVNNKTGSSNNQSQKIIKNSTSYGDKAADNITKWAGSWTFIIIFLSVLVIWMMLNVKGWIGEWDPYPFILLNLVLSCLAAIQAPIILMSQNRQSVKDRKKLEYDYSVNRKSEREIEKILRRLEHIDKKLGGNPIIQKG